MLGSKIIRMALVSVDDNSSVLPIDRLLLFDHNGNPIYPDALISPDLGGPAGLYVQETDPNAPPGSIWVELNSDGSVKTIWKVS